MTFQHTRPIGQTALKVGALGFGAAPIGNLYRAISDQDAHTTLDAVSQAGFGYIDTAPHYGQGLSERRIGMFSPDANVTISTKVGRLLTPIEAPHLGTERHGFVDGDPYEIVYDYSYDGVMRSFESSLKRLKRSHIDMLLCHDIGEVTHGPDHPAHLRSFLDGGYRAMADLKAQGLISAIGLGVNEWEICETIMDHADLDVVMLAGRYTLLEQSAITSFFPKCAAKNVSVLVAGPFNSGILARGIKEGVVAYYNYAPAPADIIARVKAIEAICNDHAVPMAAAALQFPLAHPNVACVVMGMARPDHVHATRTLIDTPIPPALWEDLRSAKLIDPLAPTAKTAHVTV